MSEAVIQVEKLGKRFHIGKLNAATTLRDALTNAVKAPFRRRPEDEDTILWALRDVSFEVKQGEVVGLIGRNGAGKSTLLKILARITRPTEGSAQLKGRIGSLLEVGTGFHPELSGRENIFLSGATLGMKKAEIQQKFEEIVAFSEVERFLDTPLKHYSSGMQMRLAFAVAAHLEPEILLVDEVLAVGDASFQRKCLGKMGEVARQGRTIIFVSHSMSAINALCSRCVILNRGALEFDGSTADATGRYYADSVEPLSGCDLSTRPRKGSGKARFTSISVQALASDGSPVNVAYPGANLRISVDLKCESNFPSANVAVILYDSTGYRLIDVNTAQKGEFLSLESGQSARAEFVLRDVLLRPGRYLIGLWIGRHGIESIDDLEHAISIEIADNPNTNLQPIVFPGTYLCHFEQTVSRLELSS